MQRDNEKEPTVGVLARPNNPAGATLVRSVCAVCGVGFALRILLAGGPVWAVGLAGLSGYFFGRFVSWGIWGLAALDSRRAAVRLQERYPDRLCALLGGELPRLIVPASELKAGDSRGDSLQFLVVTELSLHLLSEVPRSSPERIWKVARAHCEELRLRQLEIGTVLEVHTAQSRRLLLLDSMLDLSSVCRDLAMGEAGALSVPTGDDAGRLTLPIPEPGALSGVDSSRRG